MRAITATVTPASPTALVRMDNYATAVLGGAVVCSGGGSFTLQHSCDDPCDLVNPVPVGSMAWDNSLLPPAAQSGSANVSFQIMASPLWFQLNLTAATSVWSASDAAANAMTLSNGGLTATSTRSGVWNTLRGTVSKTSGKLYIEFLCVVCSQGDCNIGLGSTGMDISSYFGHSNYGGGQTYNNVTTSVGVSNGWTSGGTGPATYPVPGDVWAIAIDFTTGNTWVSKNNTWSQGNPATGTSPILVFTLATTGALFPGMGFLEGGDSWTLQSTAASQTYAPPAGFSAWDSGSLMTAEAPAQQLVGAVRATFLQVGEHSHSNITKGPFAPPKLADEGAPGTNFGAMAK